MAGLLMLMLMLVLVIEGGHHRTKSSRLTRQSVGRCLLPNARKHVHYVPFKDG